LILFLNWAITIGRRLVIQTPSYKENRIETNFFSLFGRPGFSRVFRFGTFNKVAHRAFKLDTSRSGVASDSFVDYQEPLLLETWEEPILDIRVIDEEGREYGVEIQCRREKYYIGRVTTYAFRLHVGRLKRVDEYESLKRMIGISLTCGSTFGNVVLFLERG